MVLRKNTINNSVRYIPEKEKTKEKEIKTKTIKAGSLPRKQNKNFSQNNKKFLKKLAAGGFATILIQNSIYTRYYYKNTCKYTILIL